MTGAHDQRPHSEAGTPPRIRVRPSLFLLGALGGFLALASAAVFECASGRFGLLHAVLAAVVCMTCLGLATLRWTRRQPAAIGLHADGLTLWDRAGVAHYRSIIGCAQWSGRLLALTLSSGKGRPQTLLIAADSIDPDTFRQLAVRARRAASAYL